MSKIKVLHTKEEGCCLKNKQWAYTFISCHPASKVTLNCLLVGGSTGGSITSELCCRVR